MIDGFFGRKRERETDRYAHGEAEREKRVSKYIVCTHISVSSFETGALLRLANTSHVCETLNS